MPNPSDILGGLPREIIDTINGTATARPKPSEILGGYHKELIDALSGLAHLDSPALTGTPTAPTADAGDESEQIATTEFVQQEITANPAHLELMSPTTIGGAKLGDGLALTDGALSIDPAPQESTGAVRGAIASLTAKGWATQDGTPTPESPVAIQVARGRNLIDVAHAIVGKGRSTSTGAIQDAPTVTCGGKLVPVTAGESLTKQGFSGRPRLFFFRADGTFLNSSLYDSGVDTMIAPSGAAYFDWQVTTTYITDTAQIEYGSTAHSYVPYGHVGIDITHDGTTTTIPVPLPSKGFAASLPDSTADVLTIDGAGKVEWLSAVARIESYAGESVGVPYLSTTGELTTGAEVYYPLATPTTEQVGYIDWPTIPDGAIITCPELDALGVRYLIGNGVAEMARDWYERGHTEAQSNATALGELAQQLVATDVSSSIYPDYDPTFAFDMTYKQAKKLLGFVWFGFAFTLLSDTTIAPSDYIVPCAVSTSIAPSMAYGNTTVALATSIPNVAADLDNNRHVNLHPLGEGVTLTAGTLYTISGIYYIG